MQPKRELKPGREKMEKFKLIWDRILYSMLVIILLIIAISGLKLVFINRDKNILLQKEKIKALQILIEKSKLKEKQEVSKILEMSGPELAKYTNKLSRRTK
jgi:hypothetical protein